MAAREEKQARQPLKLNRRQFLRYTVVGGSAAAFLAACAVPSQDGGSGGGAPAAEAGGEAAAGSAGGGTLIIMGHHEVASLTPDDNGPDVHYVIINNIHDGLVWYNEFNELEPVLSESYEVSEDGLTYTFKLREGVLFQDGKEFTSADVKYTYEFYGNPDNAMLSIGDFQSVGTIETPDDYTVVVNMDAVNAASLATWAEFGIVQSEYHAEVGEETYRTAPIGTGAFKVKEWRPSEYTELEAFDDHFRGRPKVDILRLDVVPEPSVRMIALQTGDAHSSVWPLLVEDSLVLAEDPNFLVYATLGNSIKHFPLNTSLPQLSEKEVRQAMMHALDRQRIIDELWSGTATVAHSNIPPSSYYHRSDLKQYEYDPEKAKSMLDEAGWVEGDDGIREKDGVKLSFTCTTISGDQARRPIAELAQQLFAEVGIDMQLAESPSVLDGMRNGSLDASLFNWTYLTNAVEPDPFGTLHSDGGNNFCQISNPELDALIEEGVTIVNPEDRKPIYDRIQEIFVEEVPVLYLQFDQWLIPFSREVQGLPEDPATSTEYYLRAYEFSLEGNG